MTTLARWTYDRLFHDEPPAPDDGDIPADAHEVAASSFLAQALAQVMTKLGDTLSSPRLSLSWLMAGLGASPSLIGLIVPLREAGALVPQLAIGSIVRRHPIRRTFWIGGALGQGACVIGIAIAATAFRGASFGWIVIGLVTLFSLARGVCSVTSKDLLGKTIPRTRRGRLSGLATSIAGALTAALGIVMMGGGTETFSTGALATLVAVAGTLWLAAALVMSRLRELPGETTDEPNALRAAFGSLGLLSEDPVFRRFVIARGFLASTVLAVPFYVLLARSAADDTTRTFAAFLVAGSVASALSGFVWGRMADRSSRRTLTVAGGAASIVGIVTFAVGSVDVWWVYTALFFLLSLAHTGIRVGRKTYVVDMASGDRRASYVAVSNTLIGIVLLTSGTLGALAATISPRVVILFFAVLGMIGTIIAASLAEVTARKG